MRARLGVSFSSALKRFVEHEEIKIRGTVKEKSQHDHVITSVHVHEPICSPYE